MKLKLTFKSADKSTKRKVIKVDAYTLMSLLNDEAVIEIAKQVYDGTYEKSGFYLSSISDND
jgi:hypothetical protein